MDSIYQLRYHDLLMICVLALLVLGVIMVQSAASGITGQVGWHWSATGTRDVVYVALAIVAFFICGSLDYRILLGRGEIDHHSEAFPSLRDLVGRPAVWIYLAGAALSLLVLIPHVGTEVNGARRWIRLGPVQLQASEVGKWGCVTLFAWLLAARPRAMRTLGGFIASLVPLGVIGILIVKEDFGTAALIGLCTLMILLAGAVRLWHVAMILPPLAAGAYYFVTREQYRMKRIMAFLNPFENPEREGYHLIQSLLSYASGGILGKGLGNGVQKLGYLPEDTTDFIFAIICEELGIAGAALTVLLYIGIVWCCWNIIRLSKDAFGKLLAFGVGAMIGLQALLNIAVATVSVPPKGLPLPLVSFGGTGLIITSAMLGLVYSVGRIWEDQAEVLDGSQLQSAPPIKPLAASITPAGAPTPAGAGRQS